MDALVRRAALTAAPGGVLDFFTFPHFNPVILNPTTGAVVSG
jgi:hypothetical protein